MRIAIVNHSFTKGGGQARVNYEITRHCLTAGCEVHVVSERVAPELLEEGAKWHRVTPAMWKPQLASNWSFARGADRFIADLRPRVDAVIGNGFVSNEPHDISICHMLHTAWQKSPYYPWRSPMRTGPNGWYQSLFTRVNSRLELETYGSAQTVIAVSRKVEHELIDAGIPASKIRVIYNGVDLEEFQPGESDRSRWNLPRDVPLALFVGGIRTALRNIESVLQALLKVPTLHLAVAGDLRQSPYPALAKRLGLADRVHFVGYRADVPDLLRAADFFVYPSRYESFSLAVLEAMSSGLPVVTAVTVGISELLDGSCGWVLDDPDDVDTLAEHMRRLTNDPTLRARMSAAARSTAKQLSWSRMTSRYVELLRESFIDMPCERSGRVRKEGSARSLLGHTS